MSQQYYTIYRTTNNLNGKWYMGSHKTNNPYDDYLGSGTKLQLSIKKYGKNVFQKEVIFFAFSNQQMRDVEEEMLIEMDAKGDKDSYNVSNTAWGFVGCRTQEWTDKINKNPEKIRKMAETHRGMKRSDASKKRMSKVKEGMYIGKTNPFWKGYWVTPFGKFESLNEAEIHSPKYKRGTIRIKCLRKDEGWYLDAPKN